MLVDDYTIQSTLPSEMLANLDTWLRDLKQGISLFQVHGFLCAVITSPVDIPPTEWFPAMLVPNLPDIRSEEDIKHHLDLVMYLQFELAERLSQDERVEPLIDYFPRSPLEASTLSPDQRQHLNEWCRGYWTALRLCSDWFYLKDHDNLELALQIIMTDAKVAGLYGVNNISVAQQQTLLNQMIDSLPVYLGILYDQACEFNRSKAWHKSKKTELSLLSSSVKS